MKIIIKRIVGFFEFTIGFAGAIWIIYRVIFDGNFTEELHLLDIVRIPITVIFFYGFIKYGWRWMFNTFDVTDEKELKVNDKFYQDAVSKARGDTDLFINYLRKGLFQCKVLIPTTSKRNSKRIWASAEFCDDSRVNVISYPSLMSRFRRQPVKRTISITEIDDWYVFREDVIIGIYTLKALAEKAISNGYTLNMRSKRLLSKIIT